MERKKSMFTRSRSLIYTYRRGGRKRRGFGHLQLQAERSFYAHFIINTTFLLYQTAPARLFYIHTYICNNDFHCKLSSRSRSVFAGQMMGNEFRSEKKVAARTTCREEYSEITPIPAAFRNSLYIPGPGRHV